MGTLNLLNNSHYLCSHSSAEPVYFNTGPTAGQLYRAVTVKCEGCIVCRKALKPYALPSHTRQLYETSHADDVRLRCLQSFSTST